MSHSHHHHPAGSHEHGDHGEPARGHAPAPRSHAPMAASLLRMSVPVRLIGAGVAIAAVWGGVLWAVA